MLNTLKEGMLSHDVTAIQYNITNGVLTFKLNRLTTDIPRVSWGEFVAIREFGKSYHK